MAESLGKFVWEIDELPYDEFLDWLAFFEYKEKERKRQERMNKSKRR